MLLLLACSTRAPGERIDPAFIEVTLGGTATGSATEPLEFSSSTVEVPVSVRTLDTTGTVYPMDGDLTVKVRPGTLDQDPFVTLIGGEWSGNVSFKNGFGSTRIWFSDEGDKDGSSGRAASWAAGVSEPIWYARPTISQMQTTDDPETNPLLGEFVNLRVEDRQVVVTALDAAGFWATDTSDATGSYNSVYVYTFGRPDEEFAVGARVTLLSGIDQEYLASTQLSFPTLEAAEGETLEVPAAAEPDGCEDTTLEKLEASRVVINSGTIPDTFVPGSEDYTDYETYGQWPIVSGSCTFYVESGSTAPDFFPGERAGQTLTSVSGMLKQIFDKWILVVVDADDLVAPSARPSSAGNR